MLKQLKYFQSVVRLGSFSAAAEENFISQSAISQQVQSLERELGFALLVRKNRSPACRSCETANRFCAHTARSGKRRTRTPTCRNSRGC